MMKNYRYWIGLSALFLASVFAGTLFSLYFQFGRISALEAISVIRSQALGNPEPVTVLNFAFFISLSFLAQVIMVTILKPKLDLAKVGIISSIFATIFGLFFVFDSARERDQLEVGLIEETETSPGSNMIQIFVESWGPSPEDNYTDSEARKFIPNEVQSGVERLAVPSGHNNTILGLLSTWCGQPITLATFSDPASEKYAMRGETCVHDHFASRGYTNVFLTGYDTAFQSKNLYLEGKSVSTYDLAVWSSTEMGENLTSWRGGLNDAALMTNLSSAVDFYANQPTPYYISALTLDTHMPLSSPIYCGEAPLAGSYRSIFSCVGSEVRNFLHEIKDKQLSAQPVLIVLQGDHPSNSGGEVFFWSQCVARGEFYDLDSLASPSSTLTVSEYMTEASSVCADK